MSFLLAFSVRQYLKPFTLKGIIEEDLSNAESST